MTPAELREKVARAISDATLDWADDPVEIWDSHRMAADAALAVVRAAMREPDAGMLDACLTRDATEDDLYMAIWRAMFDASPLGDPP